MTGEMRVNVAELRAGGLSFLDAANALPDPPEEFPTIGSDSLAQALTNRTNEVEAPLKESMPTTRSEAQTTATNIGTAADRYEQTDQQAQADVNARLAEFDSQFGNANGAGSMDAMSQFGQMISTPMQMASQLGQVPMQMASQLGQIPQAVMQGVQQFAQMGGGLGQGQDQTGPGGAGAEGPNAEEQQAGLGEHDTRDEDREERDEVRRDDGAATPKGAERAPIADSPAHAAPSSPTPAEPATPSRSQVDPSILL